MRIIPLENSPLFALVSRYSRTVVETCRAVPGMRWDRDVNAWVGYPDALAETVRALKAKGFEVEGRRHLPKPHRYEAPYVTVAEKGLRDYQKTGVAFALDRGRSGCILADVMGTGKSCTAAVAARALKAKTLILCPSHVRGVWSRWGEHGMPKGELQKWWPKARVCTPEGVRQVTPISFKKQKCVECDGCGWIPAQTYDEDVYERQCRSCRGHGFLVADLTLRQDGALRTPSVLLDYDVVVMHYDIVHAWVDTLLAWNFRTIILDEAHTALVRARSRRSQAVRILAAHASVKIALTGTPPEEYPQDFWNLADTLSPGRFGSFFAFGLRHAGGHKEEVTKNKIVWKFDGRSNLDELARRVKYFVLRRTQKDVGLNLPPLTRQIIDVDVPIRNRVTLTAHSIKDKRAVREALNLAANGKLPVVLEQIRQRVREGHNVIVFTWRRSIAEYLAAEIAKPPSRNTKDKPITSSIIHGGYTLKRRMQLVDRARLEPRHVLCCTMAAVETGIDFSFASAGIFAELSWKADIHAQCEKRLDRFDGSGGAATGITHRVIDYIIARGTGDEFVLYAVLKKLETFEAVFGKTGDNLKRDLEKIDEDDGFEALAKRLAEQERQEDRAYRRQ